MKPSVFAHIIEELKKGNNEPLKILFKEYGEYCTKNLQKKYKCPKEDAEDIFIEAVINFRHKAIHNEIRYPGNIRNYLYSTCCNMWLAKNYYDRRRQEAGLVAQELLFDHGTNDPIALQEEADENEKLLEISMEALNSMNEPCRKILQYFYMEGLTMKEIAEKLNLANSNVAKTLKSRCYKKLMEKVNELRSMTLIL